MKDYATEQIRNIAVAGHGGVGKTSVIEAMLFTTNAINRLGKIDDGNTVCDYGEDEKARKMSLFMSMCPIEWKDTKINVIDTPGFADFVGDHCFTCRQERVTSIGVDTDFWFFVCLLLVLCLDLPLR